MPIPAIEEVRSGLYLIRFSPNDIEIGEHNFHLKKCDYYPYTLVFQCPEAIEGPIVLSLIKSQSNRMKTLPVGSNYQDLARTSQGSKVVDDQPRFVWIMPNADRKVTHMKLNASTEEMMGNTKRNWGPVNCPLDKCFDLWLDFGTETLGEKKVLNQWAKQLTQQEHTDVEFNVQGEVMGAHSPIVASSSSVFASLIHRKKPSSSKAKSTAPAKVIRVTDVEPQVFQQLLHYMYSGRIPLIEEEGMADRLFKAAEKYGLENLKEECARFVLADLDEHNAIDTLIWSHKNSLFNLFDSALHFVSLNYSQVSPQSDWQNLVDNHPQICLRVSQLMTSIPGNARGT
jgi:hypothetical protein